MKNHGKGSAIDLNQSIPFSSTVASDYQVEEMRNASFMNEMEQKMQKFWNERMAEMYQAPSDGGGAHKLPLARIKKVMKSDEQVKMVSADTPLVFAKACEMFIMELSIRSWMHTQENGRRTVKRNDIVNAIRDDNLLAFLKDVAPMETYQEDLPSDNHPGVYFTAPVQGSPAYPPYHPMMNMQSQNQDEVAPQETNHPSVFPMNLSHYMNNESLQ